MYKEPHIHGANEAERILVKYKYPTEKINLVKECILSHRGSVTLEKVSKKSMCLADADAIAHIVNVPLLLYLTYVQKK